MLKKRGFVFNSVSGRPNSFANVDMVQSILILDQEMNLQPFKEKVHLWNTIKVSTSPIELTFCVDCYLKYISVCALSFHSIRSICYIYNDYLMMSSLLLKLVILAVIRDICSK